MRDLTLFFLHDSRALLIQEFRGRREGTEKRRRAESVHITNYVWYTTEMGNRDARSSLAS